MVIICGLFHPVVQTILRLIESSQWWHAFQIDFFFAESKFSQHKKQ